MKLFIASDIHGSAYYCRLAIKAFEKSNADRILLLGDILYHGPRNDLPPEYAPKQVIELLKPLGNKIFCVRGNCDTEVDQMVLPFPILADYCVIPVGERIMYATHGHKFNCSNPPPLCKGDILINGHTHIPEYKEVNDFIYMNCGSVSIPKENSPHSAMLLDNNEFLWIDIENGNIYDVYSLSK